MKLDKGGAMRTLAGNESSSRVMTRKGDRGALLVYTMVRSTVAASHQLWQQALTFPAA